jgi:rhomboid protease GluP
MDWSLVLASQEIAATILEHPENGWALEVQPEDYTRALAAIRQYRLENRKWGWRQPIPWSDATFHWGALGWCGFLILVYWMTEYRAAEFHDRARFDSAAAAAGQWWRAFTAILLHADLAHLLANVTTGLVLFGLAMARYGPALALLAALLAGAAGNGFGLVLYPKAYYGVGASGMVMGALGLISVPAQLSLVTTSRGLKQLVQAIGAGIFLFLLLGVHPASDVLAHTGGFLAGAALASILGLLPQKLRQNRSLEAVSWFIFVALLTSAIALAWTHPSPR